MAWVSGAGNSDLRLHNSGALTFFYPGGFSYLFDLELNGSDKRILTQRVDGGPIVRISNGKLAVNDWRNVFTGTNVLPVGTRLRIVIIGNSNAKTLKSWVKPVGGSITQEHNDTNFYSNTSISESPSSSNLSGKAFNVLHDFAFWDTEIEENHRFGLLNGISPLWIQPESLQWRPGLMGQGDSGRRFHTATGAAVFIQTLSNVSGNINVLKDPETHTPVEFDDGSGSRNWAVDGALNLFSSTDLKNWTLEREITTAADEGGNEVGPCDFIYDSGANRPYQCVYWINFSANGSNDVNVISSSDMVTWTNETNNPILSGVQDPLYNTGSHPGAEDFRVTKDDNGNWAAVFEHNEVGFGNAIGVATHTSSRLANNFTYQGDPFSNAKGDAGNAMGVLELNITSAILANPVIYKQAASQYLMFAEFRGAEFGTNLFVAFTHNPADPGSYRILGSVLNASGNQAGQGAAIPNTVFKKNGSVRVVGARPNGDTREYEYRDWFAQFIGSEISDQTGLSNVSRLSAGATGSNQEVITGLPVESEIALQISGSTNEAVRLGVPFEYETALDIAGGPNKAQTLNLITEVESAFLVESGSTLTADLGLVQETEVAFALEASIVKGSTLGLASEAESALPITIGSSIGIVVGLIVESEAALAPQVLVEPSVTLELVQEFENALSLQTGSLDEGFMSFVSKTTVDRNPRYIKLNTYLPPNTKPGID